VAEKDKADYLILQLKLKKNKIFLKFLFGCVVETTQLTKLILPEVEEE
jgi:hypothetical protein